MCPACTLYLSGYGIGLASLKIVDTVHPSLADNVQPITPRELEGQISQQSWQEKVSIM